MKKKLSLCLLSLITAFSFTSSAMAVYSDANVGTYSQELAKFPCDYQNKIKSLHSTYPNAIFVAQSKFLDWKQTKEVEVSWDNMVNAEIGDKSLIYYTAPDNYKNGAYNSEKTWYYASEKIIHTSLCLNHNIIKTTTLKKALKKY